MTLAQSPQVGDTSGTKLSLTEEQAADPGSKARLKYYYRPRERTRPIVFDVFDSAVAFLGIEWNQFGHMLEAPDNNTHYRWKHEKVRPSYKYVLKALYWVLQEGFRRDKEYSNTLAPLKQILARELNKLPEGYEMTIPDSSDYPYELQGDWVKKEGEFWNSKSKHILRKTDHLIGSDKLTRYLGELILENG
tara:strand:+ start:6762 stop:7334 length:573 start_codon:yes stop_codon:yes gene_type:complete